MFFFLDYSEYEQKWEKDPALKEGLSKLWRNQLLFESDWSQLTDSVLSEQKREDWAEYRQALRDVPQQSNFPDKIVWPTEPSNN